MWVRALPQSVITRLVRVIQCTNYEVKVNYVGNYDDSYRKFHLSNRRGKLVEINIVFCNSNTKTVYLYK